MKKLENVFHIDKKMQSMGDRPRDDTDGRISWQVLKAVNINILKDINENMLIMNVQTVSIIREIITTKKCNFYY